MSSEVDEILNEILAGVFANVPGECFFAGFNIETDAQIPGAFAIIYNNIKEVILKILGYPIIQFARLATLAVDIVEAIEDAILGSLDKLNALLATINEVIAWFMDFLTDTQAWIVANCLEWYENFFIPLGPVEINLIPIDLTALGLDPIVISIPLPANRAYRELADDSPMKLFDPIAIIKMITKFLDGILGTMLGYIIDFMTIVMGIVTAINDFLTSLDPTIIYEYIALLVQFFIDLAAPILKIITNFVESIIRMFNVATDEIDEAIAKCLEWIMWMFGLGSLSFDFDDLPSWMKTIFNLVLCIINLVLSLMTGILTEYLP